MSRHIDVDKMAYMVACNGDADFINKVTKLMAEAPSIDIVFCNKCKRWDRDRGERNNMQFKGYCELLRGFTDAKHFCAWSILNTEESRLLDIGIEME